MAVDILLTLKCGDSTQSKKVPASQSLLSLSTRDRTLHRLTPYVTKVLYSATVSSVVFLITTRLYPYP